MMKRKVLYFILLFSLPITVCHAEEIEITSIEPRFASRGDEIKISGKGFNVGEEGKKAQDPSAYVRFFYEYKNLKCEIVKIVEWRAEINKWQDNDITVRVPFNAKEGIVYIEVHNGIESTRPEEFWIKPTNLVDTAKVLKGSGMSDSTIVGHLSHRPEDVFGNTTLTADEIDELKQAGFQDDFIGKLEGHEQYVTIGISGIWLFDTDALAPATIVRIFLMPRSYFKKREPYWRESRFLGGLRIPKGFKDPDRWDVNIGITSSTSTSETPEDPKSEKKNYVLVGASHELNRSALFNIGFGFVSGHTTGEKAQFYVGFTLDSNFLKALGIIEK